MIVYCYCGIVARDMITGLKVNNDDARLIKKLVMDKLKKFFSSSHFGEEKETVRSHSVSIVRRACAHTPRVILVGKNYILTKLGSVGSIRGGLPGQSLANS